MNKQHYQEQIQGNLNCSNKSLLRGDNYNYFTSPMKYFCCCHLILNNKQKNFRLSFTSVLFFVCYKKPPFRSHLMDFPEKNWGVVKPENVPVTLVSNPCSSKAQLSEFEFWVSPRTPILSSLGRLFQVFLTPDLNFLHSDCAHYILFCPSTPARRATWIMRPLSASSLLTDWANPISIVSHVPCCSHSHPVVSVDVFHPPGSLKLDMIPQMSSPNCWKKRNYYFGYCFTESFAQSIHLRPVLLYQNIPRCFFFALRCKLIYDKKMEHKNNI